MSDERPIPDLPGVERIEALKWFRFVDLEGRARDVARQYGMLAAATAMMCPPGAQRDVALQKLLEARDAAIRAVSE